MLVIPQAMDETFEMVDGLPSESRHCLAGPTLLEQVESAWQFASGRHEEMLKRIAQTTANELTAWLRWINNLAAQKGVHLDVVFIDSPAYGARVKRSHQAKYRIEIDLGTIPALLYIAPIVDMSFRDEFTFWHDIEQSVKSLKQTGFPNTSITSYGESLVVSAVTMVFLHEVAHALGGHLMWPDIGRDKSADLPRYTISYRAAETDADWGAGRMFAIGLFEQRTAINDIARRLVGSATINHIALQIRSGPTKRYHLPQLRMIVNIHGADSACHVFGIDQNAFHNAVCQCTALSNEVWA